MCFILRRKILAELRLILLSRVTAQKTAEGKTTHRAENSVVASNSHLPFHSSYTLHSCFTVSHWKCFPRLQRNLELVLNI